MIQDRSKSVQSREIIIKSRKGESKPKTPKWIEKQDLNIKIFHTATER